MWLTVWVCHVLLVPLPPDDSGFLLLLPGALKFKSISRLSEWTLQLQYAKKLVGHKNRALLISALRKQVQHIPTSTK